MFHVNELSRAHQPCYYRLSCPIKGILGHVTRVELAWVILTGIFLFFNMRNVEFSLNCKQYTCVVMLRELLLFVSKYWIWNFLSHQL